MTIEELREWKKELGYSNERIAELSGNSIEKIREIFEGKECLVDYIVLQELEKVLVPVQLQTWPPLLKEETARYLVSKRQGEYTIEDYLALPEQCRVELIDGVIYDMGAPNFGHQAINIKISTKLFNYIDKMKGKCMVVTAPTDVQLDCDNKTMLQPDILIVCDRRKLTLERVFGAPDFVVEVLSLSTRKKDLSIKMRKYKDAGVREYWIVDPIRRRVHVYEFERSADPVLYTFKDKVPVGIFNGECEVDFKEIYDSIKFLYEK